MSDKQRTPNLHTECLCSKFVPAYINAQLAQILKKCLYPGILKHIPFCKTKQTDRYCILISICSQCQWNEAKNRLRTQIFEKLASLGFITSLVEFGCNGHSRGLVHLALKLVSQNPFKEINIHVWRSKIAILNNSTVEVKHCGTWDCSILLLTQRDKWWEHAEPCPSECKQHDT